MCIPKKDGKWRYWAIVFSLTRQRILSLGRRPFSHSLTPKQLLFAALHAYDLRSGGVETSNKGSKQGLGITKRNQRRFAAKEMLVLLVQLAYNLLSWVLCLLSPTKPCLQRFGLLCMVRDVFYIPGLIRFDGQGHIQQRLLCSTSILALPFLQAISPLLAQDEMVLNLGQI